MIDSDQILPDDLSDECRQIAEVIGMDALLALVAARGGECVYLPKYESLAAASRNRQIRAEFNGRNYRDLAKRYNLTVRWVREIVSSSNQGAGTSRNAPLDTQLQLF